MEAPLIITQSRQFAMCVILALACVMLPAQLATAGERVAVAGTHVTLEPLADLVPASQGMLITPLRIVVIVNDVAVDTIEADIASIEDPQQQAASGLRDVVVTREGVGDRLRYHMACYGREGDADFRKHFYFVREGARAAFVIVAVPIAVYSADTAIDQAVEAMVGTLAFSDTPATVARVFTIALPGGYQPLTPGMDKGKFQTMISEDGKRMLIAVHIGPEGWTPELGKSADGAIGQSLAKHLGDVRVENRNEGTSQGWTFVEILATGISPEMGGRAKVVARMQGGPAGSYILMGFAPEPMTDTQLAEFRTSFESIQAVAD